MAFDICGPLPQGTTLLEASAGTGKTFTIAALATRYVAEGLAELSQVMLVTFGRAATQELRERVRERLVATEHGLRDPVAARNGEDHLVRLLADVDDAELGRRRRRLVTALAGFDGATIATTHGFCQQMLAGLGLAGDSPPDATFMESISDLVTEVVDDLYLRKFARPGAAAPMVAPGKAREVVRAAVGDPLATLAPDGADPLTEAGQRVRLAHAARTEVAARMRRRGLLDFDDLIGLLRGALADPFRGEAARERVRSRYRVVLVDEFQDTDQAQWDVLRLAFHGHTTLVLIGDPKQAVYGFRGGDVATYLAAAAVAATRETLGCNWRSDELLVQALDRVYGGAALGDPRIVVLPVDASHSGSRLPAGTAPLRLRRLRRDQCGPLSGRGLPAVANVRRRVAADVANQVARLLSDGMPIAGRPARPADLAVLVRTNHQGALVRDSLAAAGVPVVLAGNTSVFATASAREWLVLLLALEQPHRPLRARAVALTPFVGWSAGELDAKGDTALEVLGPWLRGWAAVLADRGVAALFEVAGAGLAERLLAEVDGERRLTDLRHIAQALHSVSRAEALGLTALLEWLRRRMAEVGIDGEVERSRRLESDAEAVQIVTVHRSKGLEFPVVYVPFGWDRAKRDSPDPLLLHDRTGLRVMDVGGKDGPGYAERRVVHEEEDSGEELRLLYVALTRAKCQVVAWWAPATTTRTAPLHRLLLGGRDGAAMPSPAVPVLTDELVGVGLAALAVPGLVDVEQVDGASARWQPATTADDVLSAAVFSRALDTTWRRTSYSALTAAAHDAHYATDTGVASEQEQPELRDEPPSTDQPQPGPDTAMPALPMAALPGGTSFGTLVHEVFELVDTAEQDLLAEITGRCAAALSDRPVAAQAGPLDPDTLAAALLPVFQTPLGPLAAGRRLCDVAPTDRLAELGFELPLAGGDDPRSTVPLLTDIAPLLRRHLPPGHPLAGYPDLLATLEPQALRGYLSGSIDALLRVDGRYVVVDYKTNRLPGEPLTAWHYRPEALADAMLAAHYPLQALLYCVAAHRFLRWRLPAYDVERHLGGVLYLFVRGMTGPDTPTVDGVPAGVFGWRPSPALVTELSALLDRRP